MTKNEEDFLQASANKVYDLSHRKTINFNIGKYNLAVARGLGRLTNLEQAKKRAHVIKWHSIEYLDKYLVEFETNFTRNGGKVLWANTIEEAQENILQIAQRHEAKSVIKSKSMVTEEIGLNHFLEKNDINVLESDLGEFIVQLLGQKPYHIVTPAMHLSKKNIAELFHYRFKTSKDASAEELTQKARELLRTEFTSANIGVTGANFLIADTGSISVTENEGNARLSTTFPKVHIAIVGIEKVIPSITDLDLFLPLLATHGTGQNLTVYNSIISGPKKSEERDGPEEMYVILLDNGRSKLLEQKEQRQAAYCIRCGACLNVCPIYKNIGGHAYNTTYSGPIGSVITPHLQGMDDFKHLSYASSLCGKCTEVCPVNINVQKMLLLNRKLFVEQGLNSFPEKIGWKIWGKLMLNRKWMDKLSGKWKNLLVKYVLRNKFGTKRTSILFSEESLAQRNTAQDKKKK